MVAKKKNGKKSSYDLVCPSMRMKRYGDAPAYHDSFRPLPPVMLQNLEPQIRPLHLIPRELGFQMGRCLSVDRASPTSSPCSIALKSHELIGALKTDFTFHSMTHLRTRSLSKLPHLYTQVWISGGVGVGWGGVPIIIFMFPGT